SQLPIDQSPEAHITVKRYEELTRWVEIFHPVVDIFDRLEVARLAGKRCALFKSRGIDRKLLPSRARRYPQRHSGGLNCRLHLHRGAPLARIVVNQISGSGKLRHRCRRRPVKALPLLAERLSCRPAAQATDRRAAYADSCRGTGPLLGVD